MEKRIPVTNNTKMNMHVGSNIVPPGETRDFPESQVPHHFRPVEKAEEAPAPAPQTDPLAELLNGTVKAVTAALPAMADADIERLGELEQAGQARKGVLGSIADVLLNRAAQAGMLERVAAFNDKDLAEELDAVLSDTGADPDYIAALEAEAAKRNPGAAE